MALSLACLLPLARAESNSRPPDFIASQKAKRLYEYYLDSMMPAPGIHTQNVSFRIANDISSGSSGEVPEFHLDMLAHVKRVNIKYPVQGSIYSALYQYFLENADVTLDAIDYLPPLIHKRIPYDKCPELEPRLLAVEQYIRTSLFSTVPSEHTGISYVVGYSNFHYDLTYEISSPKARPVPELLEIKDIALRCARDLPTVEEERKAEEARREQEHEEYLRNFKGPLLESPPPIVLRHGDRTYESAVGTSCWGMGSDKFCNDVFAYVTPREPIVVRRGDRLHLEIPVRDWLESMDLGIARVTANDVRKREEDKEFTDIIIWKRKVRERPMSESELESIVINKPPGKYILSLYGNWKEYGDASHGFYLEVRP